MHKVKQATKRSKTLRTKIEDMARSPSSAARKLRSMKTHAGRKCSGRVNFCTKAKSTITITLEENELL